MDAIVRRIEQINNGVGVAVSWLTVVMVVVTFVVVLLRYLFDSGWIWLQESITWMHAAVFMLAAAYTLAADGHVRVDVFYRNMSVRGQAIVNTLGTLLFLMPFTIFLLWSSWDYVSVSWQIREASRESGGLPYPLVPMLKTFIPATAALLLLQGIAIVLTNIRQLVSRSES